MLGSDLAFCCPSNRPFTQSQFGHISRYMWNILRCLPSKYRIAYRIAALIWRCLLGRASVCLWELWQSSTFSVVVEEGGHLDDLEWRSMTSLFNLYSTTGPYLLMFIYHRKTVLVSRAGWRARPMYMYMFDLNEQILLTLHLLLCCLWLSSIVA